MTKLLQKEENGIRLFIVKYDKEKILPDIGDMDIYRISSRFLRELFSNMALLAIKYKQHQSTVRGESPYTYGERQLDGLIVPALSRICDGAILTELPISRKYKRGKNAQEVVGRIDYWCMYRNYSFILEVKHSYDNFRTKKMRTELKNDWETMCDSQLRSVRGCAKKFEEKTKGIISIGLQFVTSWNKFTHGESVKNTMLQYEEKLPELLDRLREELVVKEQRKTTTPNFTACWIPPQKHVERMVADEIYPGLIMIAKICKPIFHRGSRQMNKA